MWSEILAQQDAKLEVFREADIKSGSLSRYKRRAGSQHFLEEAGGTGPSSEDGVCKKEKQTKRGIPARLDAQGKPASWRVDTREGGLARHKGEKKSYNYGFMIPDKALCNPYWAKSPDLPDIGTKKKARPRKKKKKKKLSKDVECG